MESERILDALLVVKLLPTFKRIINALFHRIMTTGMVPPLGDGALRKLRTLRIGSGGTGYQC